MFPGHPEARKASEGEELESVGGCEAFGALRGDDPVVTEGQQLDYTEGLTSNLTTPSFLVFKSLICGLPGFGFEQNR